MHLDVVMMSHWIWIESMYHVYEDTSHRSGCLFAPGSSMGEGGVASVSFAWFFVLSSCKGSLHLDLSYRGFTFSN